MATPATGIPAIPPIVSYLVKNYAVSELTKTGLSILVVYSTHYATTKLYNVVCVPDGLSGFLFGFVTTASPWCKFMLELMKLSENQYSAIILLLFSRVILQGLGI
jgi:hypothetical protein